MEFHSFNEFQSFASTRIAAAITLFAEWWVLIADEATKQQILDLLPPWGVAVTPIAFFIFWSVGRAKKKVNSNA